jgi:excisionase family DNA binding protein
MIKQSARAERLLTIEEGAETLNVSVRTLWRRISQGELPVIRDGRIVRIQPDDLRHYILLRRNE